MVLTRFSFPYGESVEWFSPAQAENLAPIYLTKWLTSKDSLTAKLKSHCKKFSVTLVDQNWQQAQESRFWNREVLLFLDHIPWVFASTQIPEPLINNATTGIQNLGERPLGELLYSNQTFKPGKIEVAQFTHCERLRQLTASLNQSSNEPIWGRRRYFNYQSETLIVSEVFLPSAVSAIRSMSL